jgi:hypothetical protein
MDKRLLEIELPAGFFNSIFNGVVDTNPPTSRTRSYSQDVVLLGKYMEYVSSPLVSCNPRIAAFRKPLRYLSCHLCTTYSSFRLVTILRRRIISCVCRPLYV